MKKIISNKTIHFYDDENNEIMYIDHSTDECIWYFYSDNIINVTEDMELYNLLYIFMNNYYDFGDEILQNYKDSNKLIETIPAQDLMVLMQKMNTSTGIFVNKKA